MRMAIPTLYQLGAVRRRLCQVKSDHGPLAARLVHVKAFTRAVDTPCSCDMCDRLARENRANSSSTAKAGLHASCAGRLTRCMLSMILPSSVQHPQTGRSAHAEDPPSK
jgi:hypothetical protein